MRGISRRGRRPNRRRFHAEENNYCKFKNKLLKCYSYFKVKLYCLFSITLKEIGKKRCNNGILCNKLLVEAYKAQKDLDIVNAIQEQLLYNSLNVYQLYSNSITANSNPRKVIEEVQNLHFSKLVYRFQLYRCLRIEYIYCLYSIVLQLQIKMLSKQTI